MDFQLRCGNCKGERSFDKLKRDDFSKRYHLPTLVYVYLATLFIITVNHVITINQDNNRTQI